MRVSCVSQHSDHSRFSHGEVCEVFSELEADLEKRCDVYFSKGHSESAKPEGGIQPLVVQVSIKKFHFGSA